MPPLRIYEPPPDDDGVMMVESGLPTWPTILLIVILAGALVALLW